jgi:hypothetical protein
MFCSSCHMERSPDQLSACLECGAEVCGLYKCTGSCICSFSREYQEGLALDRARDFGIVDDDMVN